MTPVRRRATALAAAAAAAVAIDTSYAVAQQPAPAAPATAPLTSPAIDHSIYRDGEVRRSTQTFGAWQLVCDEVTRLRHRFCSLRTVIHAAAGGPIAALTVSTGEDGRPAALLRVPDDRAAGATVNILLQPPQADIADVAKSSMAAAAKPARNKLDGQREPITQLRPAACENGACTFIWSLTASQIKALNAGLGLWISYAAAPPLTELSSPQLTFERTPRTVSIAIDTSGFAAAVDASLHFDK